MKPYNVTLWVYADSDAEAQAFQQELNDFVVRKYNQGIYVRAGKLGKLLKQYGNNPMVSAFLK
ncbi:MAG: hypothetical protein IJ882_08145 [Paludibacteraceae bacterium]|nr:hypothetical protein [Paludibacteraceae bacterium]MBR3647637.1 hypothetical protein [Paludibacteraceae bacterium]